MGIKRREAATYNELIRTFVKHQGGRLLHVAERWEGGMHVPGQWLEATGSKWVKIPNRKVNRLLRNSGWDSRLVNRVRADFEQPLCPLVHKSGPLPTVSVEAPPAATATPVTEEFIVRHAGRLIYNHKSKCWMSSLDGSTWEYILDREIDALLCEISGELSLVSLNKVRRELERHIGFAVKEMVS